MSEHRIRLRGAWQCHFREGDSVEGTEVVRRVDLPCKWPDDLPGRIQLIRKFGKPPIDFQIERMALELVQIRGLLAGWLNGGSLVRVKDQSNCWSVKLPEPLLLRNTLVLDLDLDEARQSDSSWGEISLLIQPR